MAETLAGEVGLPVKTVMMELDSGLAALKPQAGAPGYIPDEEIEKVHFYYVPDVADHMEVVAGQAFDDTAPTAELAEVWMHNDLAEKLGINMGEEFLISVGQNIEPFPIKVVGFWQSKADDIGFWSNTNPDTAFVDRLLVRRNDLVSLIEPNLPLRGRSVTWQVVLDEDQIVPADARFYVEGFEAAQQVINKYLPDARVTAPSVSLGQFVNRQDTLTTILLGFNIPALGFLLYFLVLTSAVIAYWQRREAAILVSRGMRISNLLIFTLIEQAILFVIGLPLGILFGVGLAILMGYTVSFLSFETRDALPVSLQGLNFNLIFLAMGAVLLARLLPNLKSARISVVEQEREHSRPQTAPFWYRNYLDLLLILPTYYAYQQLHASGTLALFSEGNPDELFQDPLLVIVPGLFILTIALVTMRLFPLLMRLLDVVASLLPWTTPHMALRQLGRQAHIYINPLLLVIVSLALGRLYHVYGRQLRPMAY